MEQGKSVFLGRVLCVLAIMVGPLAGKGAWGQAEPRPASVPVRPVEALPEGKVFQNRLIAVGTGKVVLPGKGRDLQRLDSRAEARMLFEERPLGEGEFVRYFSDAAVGLLIRDQKSIRELRSSVRLMRCRVQGAELVVWCPVEPLEYAEAEMVRFPFDPVCAGDLLPPEGVTHEGKTWAVPTAAVARLLRLDKVTGGNLQVVCESVKSDVIEFRVAGTVTGEFNFAPTRLTVNAQVTFDRAQRIVTGVVADIDEIKSPGPVDAGFEGRTNVTLRRTIADAVHLTSEQIKLATAEGAERYLGYYVYRHPDGVFSFLYPRVWKLHYADNRNVVLKWFGPDGLIGQCNVSLGHKTSPGTHTDRAAIRRTVEQGLGERLQKVLEDRELPLLPGGWVHRLAVAGTTAEGPVLWYYYTVAGPDGQHVNVVFSVPAEESARFGTADLTIMQTFRLKGIESGTTAATQRESERR